ncbi:MAG: cryptochrome/photolyase family protein [candidate division WOR-3 bacterium]
MSGDQLNRDSVAFDGFEPAHDAVRMAKVAGESTRFWPHKALIATSLSAMLHVRDALRAQGVTVHYRQLDDTANTGSFRGELTATVSRLIALHMRPFLLLPDFRQSRLS